MNYRIYIYAIMLFTTTFAVSGLNINSIFKKNHNIEAKICIILLIMSITYLTSSLIINFIESI